MMKFILTILLSFILVVSGSAQTRNVVVGTNGAVVQPTNFWSADVTNARSGLGLGSASTNPASAFQPSSSVLSNLVSGGALTFSNITVGISNVTGLQTALDGKLGTNPTLFIANISNLQTTLDSKLGTNPTLQISNIAALQTALDAKLTASFPLAISNVSGLQSALDTKLGTNPTLGISNITGLQTNLDSKLSTTGSAANLTNFPTVALASNITGTAALATNVTGVVALVNGGTGATNISGARTALGVGSSDVFVGLTNLGSGGNLGFSSSPYILGSTNSTTPNNAVLALDAAGVRSVAGLTLAALTNTTTSDFRTAIGLGSAATNPATAFQPSSSILTNLASSNGGSLTNLIASNVTGTIAISNGGSGAITAGGARTNLGLGATNNVVFDRVQAASAGSLTNLSFQIGAPDLGFYNSQGPDKINIVVGGTNRATISSSGISASLFSGGFSVGAGQSISFSGGADIATTRTNLGLGWPALTNSNAGTGLVSVNTNGEVVSPTNFWQVSPANTRVQVSQPVVNATNAATNARNLYFYSLAISTTGVTNTITLPTNGGTLLGDVVTVIHEGPTSSVTAVRQIGSGTNLITLNQFQEAVKFIYESGGWRLADNISYVEPIYFSGTNAAVNAAASRTNLGIGATWLTNTNVTNFRTAIGLGATNQVTFQSANIVDGVTVGEVTLTSFGIDASPWGGGQLDFEEMQFFGNTNNDWDFGGNGIYNFGAIAFANTTNAATTRTALGLGATWLTNTNVTNFRTAIGLGVTNDVKFNSVGAGGGFVLDFNNGNIYDSDPNNVVFTFSGTWHTPIAFNNTANAATTRTNLGLPLAALTNTSVTNFQKAIFYTNTAPSNIGGNLGTIAAWIEIVASNGVTYKIPAYTNVP